MAIKIKNNRNIVNIRKITPVAGNKLYAQLRKQVTQAGILDRSYFYYSVLIPLEFACFFFFLGLFIIQKNPLPVVIATVGVSIFSVRFGGLIHDAGHRALFKSSLINDLFGYFCSSFIAFPYLVWQVKHNAHHAHTNEEGADPDLEVPISFTGEMMKRNTPIVKIFRKYQAWLFYPLGSLVSITFRIKAFKFYMKELTPKVFVIMTLQFIGVLVWYVAPFFVFPLWKALLFVLLSSEVGGFYMLNIFAPNHKGMPQLEKGVKISFLEHQIITSRNIYSHWATNYLYMGLNFQIEHHLFPNCPRNKLKLITPYVREICKKYRLNYMQMGMLESSRFILSELHETSLKNKN